MKRTAAALVLAGSIAAPGGAVAQDTAALRDSIAAVADTAMLRRMASALAPAATVAEHLRRGFASLRLYEITGERAHADHAQRTFQRAHELAPDDVYAQLGLGLSLAAIADAEDADPPRVVTGRAFAAALGIDARARARRTLERVLALEPSLAGAAAALAAVALATRDADALAAARAALLRVTANGVATPATWLARARVALALDDPADASAAARAAAAAGAEPAAGYVLAVALLRTDGREDEGARAYFQAAERSTDATAALFADELRELWDQPERLRWDSLDAAGRRVFLTRFWETRAALAGVTVAERLAEHERRLATAFARYRRKTRWGAPPGNALLLDRPDGRFDDRGIILVRHGAPLGIIRTVARDVRPNESWVYRDAAGENFLLHFAEYGSVLGPPGGTGDRGGFADYVLLYELPCAPDWVGDRVAYDYRLNPLLRRCTLFDRKSISMEVRRDAYAALATDSDAPRFARDLAFAYDVYAFRGAAGATDLVAAASVAAADLGAATAATDAAGRSIALSLIVVDTADDVVARADTVVRSAADTLLVYASLRSRPVTGAVLRVLARDAESPRHGRLRGGEIDIPSFRADTLMLSDIVLAASGTPAADDPYAWRRGDAILRFAPGATFGESTFRVFFEIYNLEPNAAYATEIRVESRAGGIGGRLRRLFGARPPLRLRFEDVAAADASGVVRVLRDVRADLPPGRWTLHVTITGPSGETVRRARPFAIAGPR